MMMMRDWREPAVIRVGVWVQYVLVCMDAAKLDRLIDRRACCLGGRGGIADVIQYNAHVACATARYVHGKLERLE